MTKRQPRLPNRADGGWRMQTGKRVATNFAGTCVLELALLKCMSVPPPPPPPLDTSKTSEPSARGGFMETNFWACMCGRIYSVFGLRGSRPPESRGGGSGALQSPGS